MIIHLVPQEFTYSFLTPDARRIDISDETHNPLDGVGNFQSFFGRIDGRERKTPLRLDTTKVGNAFWDRDEFLDALREICADDVYIQASDWYSMAISFVRHDDHEKFEQRCAERKAGWGIVLDQGFEAEVRAFLDTLGVSRHEYDAVLSDGNYNYLFREQTVAELCEIKFAFSKPGDHSKPKPSLQAAYAQIAQTVPMGSAPPEAIAA